MCDIRQEQYATVIREMIRHENDVTNHRIMWLLIGQGFLANAYVSAKSGDASTNFLLPLVGITVTLSAFLMLYKSYQAPCLKEGSGRDGQCVMISGILLWKCQPVSGWPVRCLRGYLRDDWDRGSFASRLVPPDFVTSFCVSVKDKSGVSEFPVRPLCT